MRKLLVHKPSRNRWWVGFGLQALVCCPWLGWFVCDLIQTKNWNFSSFRWKEDRRSVVNRQESLPISGLSRWLHGKESACSAGDAGDTGLIPRLGERQYTPVFLPGQPHGQRSLVGYSPGRHKQSGMTEWLNSSGDTDTEKRLMDGVGRKEASVGCMEGATWKLIHYHM